MSKKVSAPISSQLVEELRQIGAQEFKLTKTKKDDARAVNLGKEIVFLDYLGATLKGAFGREIPKSLVAKKPPKGKPLKRVLNLVLSDTHFGSNPDPRETRNKYGPLEASRRLAKVIRQAITYKTEHRDYTHLNMHILGDMFQGQLHDPRDGEPLAEQMGETIHLLAQAVKVASQEFPQVNVAFQPGNHGRNTARHKDRATFQKWDSNETVVYYAIKTIAKMAKWDNVRFALPYTPYYLIDTLGHGIFGTHGDTVLHPGNPHKTINVGALTNQVNKIVAAEARIGGIQPKLFIMGHVHIGTDVNLPSDITVITNGCLLPPDPYALSIGAFDSACGQQLFETTEEHAFGDHRFIRVNEKTDKDSSLDGLILPYTGLDS